MQTESGAQDNVFHWPIVLTPQVRELVVSHWLAGASPKDIAEANHFSESVIAAVLKRELRKRWGAGAKAR